jgi:hypothetical protein
MQFTTPHLRRIHDPMLVGRRRSWSNFVCFNQRATKRHLSMLITRAPELEDERQHDNTHQHASTIFDMPVHSKQDIVNDVLRSMPRKHIYLMSQALSRD